MVVKGDMHKGFDPIELKGDILLWWDGPRAFQLDDRWTIWEWQGWEDTDDGESLWILCEGPRPSKGQFFSDYLRESVQFPVHMFKTVECWTAHYVSSYHTYEDLFRVNDNDGDQV